MNDKSPKKVKVGAWIREIYGQNFLTIRVMEPLANSPYHKYVCTVRMDFNQLLREGILAVASDGAQAKNMTQPIHAMLIDESEEFENDE